jgi:hypothetical protein
MEVLEAFKKELEETFKISPVIKIDEDVKYIETHLYPEILKVLQKDETLFEVDHILMGVNLSELWKTNKMPKDVFWKNMQMICVGSILHGDINEKITLVIAAAKKFFGMAGNENAEISKILDDEKSEDRIKEIFKFVMETRLAKIFMSIMEQFDVADLNIDITNTEECLNMLKDPSNPKLKKFVDKIQKFIKTKIERGEIGKNQIVEELEAIKAKITSVFGSMFLNTLGGGNGGISSADMMGNSPEARRQRMLARLQKKQREKNSL